jgi:hypothetical protein
MCRIHSAGVLIHQVSDIVDTAAVMEIFKSLGLQDMQGHPAPIATAAVEDDGPFDSFEFVHSAHDLVERDIQGIPNMVLLEFLGGTDVYEKGVLVADKVFKLLHR